MVVVTVCHTVGVVVIVRLRHPPPGPRSRPILRRRRRYKITTHVLPNGLHVALPDSVVNVLLLLLRIVVLLLLAVVITIIIVIVTTRRAAIAIVVVDVLITETDVAIATAGTGFDFTKFEYRFTW